MWQFVDDALRLARPWAGKAMQAGKGLWSKAGPAAQGVVTKLGPRVATGAGVGGVVGGLKEGPGGIIPGALGGGVMGGTLGAIPAVAGAGTTGQVIAGGLSGVVGPGVYGGVTGAAKQGAGTVGGAGALQMQNVPNVDAGGYIGGGSPVPNVGGVHGGMMVGPDGNIYQQIDPTGYRAGARMGSGLDTMQNISNYNRWADARFGERERIRKADMEREIAAQQLRRNMDLAFNISNRAHATTSNIAEQAARDQGTLLNSNVRYF